MTDHRKLIIGYLPATNNGLSFRGSEISLYDYAHFAETLLGNKSIICLQKRAFNEPVVLKKFQDRFPTIITFDNPQDLERQLEEHKVDALYTIRAKPAQGLLLSKIPMLIHCVYEMSDAPRGFPPSVIAGVSKTVADRFGREAFVPHMINLHECKEDYRSILGIPKEAIVYGRHGGVDTWDLPMAREAVLKALEHNSNIYFLFAVRPHILRDVSHPRLICINAFADLKVKRKFINTVNFYLHAQSMGESFGISCGEMSMANKPVIVWDGGSMQEHLRILGDKCIKYRTADELYSILTTLEPSNICERDWRAYGQYIPDLVMKQFDQVFLEPLKRIAAQYS